MYLLYFVTAARVYIIYILFISLTNVFSRDKGSVSNTSYSLHSRTFLKRFMNITYDYLLMVLLSLIVVPALHARDPNAYSCHLMISRD